MGNGAIYDLGKLPLCPFYFPLLDYVIADKVQVLLCRLG